MTSTTTSTYTKKVVHIESLNESEKVELDWLRKTIKDYESRENHHKAELDKIRKEEHRLQGLLVNQQKKEDEFKETTEKLQAEVNRLKSFIKKKEQDEEKALKEVQFEKNSHNETLKAKRELERRVSEYEKELQKVSNLSGQFATLEAKVASSEALYNEAQNKIKALSDEKAQLEKELRRDREANQASGILINKLQESNNELKQKHVIYEETITTLKEDLLKIQNIYYETKSLLEKAQVDSLRVKTLEKERDDLAGQLASKLEAGNLSNVDSELKHASESSLLKLKDGELNKLKAELESLRLERDKERERLHLSIQNLQASIVANENRYKLELEDHDKKHLIRLEEIRRAKDSALQANIKLRESENERDILRQQLESLRAQFNGLESAYIQLKTPTKNTPADPKLYGEIEGLKNELKAKNEQMTNLKASLDSLGKSYHNAVRDNEDKDQKLKDAQEKITKLEAELKGLRTQLELLKKDLQSESDRAKKLEEEYLNRGLNSKEEENKYLRSKVLQLEKELQETREKERSSQTEREILNNMYSHAVADLEKYRNDFLQNQNRTIALEKECAKLRGIITGLENNLADRENENKILKTELHKKEQEIEIAKTRADQWATEYKRMKLTYDELERQLSNLARRSEYESKKIADLEKEKNDLQNKLNDKDKELEDLKISHKIILERKKSYEEKINKLINDINELRRLLSESEHKEKHANSIAQTAEMNLAQVKIEREKYKAETVDLSARIDALNTTLHKFNEEVALLNGRIRTLENELEKERAMREALSQLTAKGPTELHFSDQDKEITKLKILASATAKHYEKACEKIKELEQKLREMMSHTENNQHKLQEKEKAHQNLLNLKLKCEEVIRELGGQLQRAQEEAYKYKSLYDTLAIQNKDLNKDLADAKREIEEYKQKYHEIYYKKQEAEKALEEKDNEIKELLKRIAELEEDVKFTREKLSKRPDAIPSSPSNLNQVNKLTKELLIAEQRIKDLEQELKNLETEKVNYERYKNEYHTLLKEFEKLKKKAEQDEREMQDLLKKNRNLEDQLNGAYSRFYEQLKLDLNSVRENILSKLKPDIHLSSGTGNSDYDRLFAEWRKERSKLIQDLLEERGERQKLQIELRNFQIRGQTKITEIVSFSSTEGETKKRKIETLYSPAGSASKRQRRLSTTPLILPFPGYENEIIENGATHASIFSADANIKYHSPGFKVTPEQVKEVTQYFAPTQSLSNSKVTLGNQTFSLHTRNHNELIGSSGDSVCVIRKGVKSVVFAICPKAKQADVVEAVKDVVNNVDDLGGVREMEVDTKK